jgi:2,4-diaminopentanoate dehydrogenase
MTSSSGKYRVIQWATGNVGRCAIEGIVNHPELELVGCWVSSEAKHGRDAGEIAGIGPIGVAATMHAQEIFDLDADAVVYAPMLASPKDVIQLLESGKNVVTPVGWVYPFEGGRRIAEIEAACAAGNATLHGTGIHPGGITERFPLMVSAMSTNIRRVHSEEFSDIRNYGTEFVVREVMLFGKPLDVARESKMVGLLGDGFNQSIDMIAAAMGVSLDAERPVVHEMAVATRDLDTPVGVIEAGTVAAQRFQWQGCVEGVPVITTGVNWLMGEEHLDPPWTFGPRGQRFEVEIDGDPPIGMTFHGLHPHEVGSDIDRNAGILATAMHCVNAVPYAVDAGPGIKTYLDLPLIAGRFPAR